MLLVISILAFTLTRLMPGTPGESATETHVRQADLLELRAAYRLDDPIPIQYVAWLARVLAGDLGRSFVDQRPVLDKILERLPATLQLSLATFLVGMLGVPLGVLAAVKQHSVFDRVLGLFNASGSSVPHWWVGLLILVFVAGPTQLLPLGGMYSIGKEHDLLDRLWHLMLPATVGATGNWILFSRYLRSSLLEVLHLDYVRVAQAKGLTREVVLWRHAFRNALIPIIPFFVLSITGLISGSVLYENTFAWPGIGRLAVQAAFQRDYPVVMALTLITSMLTIVGLVLVDILYVVIDPRIKYS